MWEPQLQDSYCLKQLSDELIYQDVVRNQAERRAALRERLPATLAEFGVKL